MDFSSVKCADRVVIKRGYLKKLPNQSKFGSSFKRWERRWFVFCTVNNSPCLEYYEDEDSFLRQDPPINIIWLTTTQYVIQALADEKHENMFNIGMTDRILSLIAPTRDEMSAWCKVIEQHLSQIGILESLEDRYGVLPGQDSELPQDAATATPKACPLHVTMPNDATGDLQGKGASAGSFEDVDKAKARANRRSADESSFEDVTVAKSLAMTRAISESSADSDVFEDVTVAKKLAQSREPSERVEPSVGAVGSARSISTPSSEQIRPVPAPRNKSLDEIERIKLQNRMLDAQAHPPQSSVRDPRSTLPPIPDESMKKGKGLDPPNKPLASLEKSPRSRRHLDHLEHESSERRVDENHYEPPRQWPEDFPTLPPPPPPNHPAMRRSSEPCYPSDMYGALWNENTPPTLPQKAGPPPQRRNSRPLKIVEDCRQPDEPPPVPPNRLDVPQRSVSIDPSHGNAPIQAAGLFDPEKMKNIMDNVSQTNKDLLRDAKERGVYMTPTRSDAIPGSAHVRAHSVRGIMVSPTASLSLKEREVEQLRQEISHPGGVQLQLRKKDCHQTLALVNFRDAVWVAGWNQKASPFLHNAFHVGDRIVSINGQDVIDAEHALKLIKQTPAESKVDFIARRTPHANVYAIKRSAEGESLGFKREGGTAEIHLVSLTGLAARHGLPLKAMSIDGIGLCNWVLTEINNRPLNLFFKDKEIEHRLNAVGKDISFMVQPFDFISAIKKQLKKLKGFKDFLVQ